MIGIARNNGKKVKKMNWLKRKLRAWLLDENHLEKVDFITSKQSSPEPDGDPILSFRIFSAVNGKVLEFRKYDRVKDTAYTSIYIIDKDTDIGEYVSKCASLEMLK
jgi:hypothetical protein